VRWWDNAGNFGTVQTLGSRSAHWWDSRGQSGSIRATSPRLITWSDNQGNSGTINIMNKRLSTWSDNRGSWGTVQKIGPNFITWWDNRGNHGRIQKIGRNFMSWSDNSGNYGSAHIVGADFTLWPCDRDCSTTQFKTGLGTKRADDGHAGRAIRSRLHSSSVRQRFGCDLDTSRQRREKDDNLFDPTPRAARTRHTPADKVDTGRVKDKRAR